MDPTSPTELLHFEDIPSELENLVDNNYSPSLETKSETCKNSSDGISLGFESINSEMTYATPKCINKEMYNNQLIILEPNNPVMVRFQKTLKLHLLKQRENIKKELQTLVSIYFFYSIKAVLLEIKSKYFFFRMAQLNLNKTKNHYL